MLLVIIAVAGTPRPDMKIMKRHGTGSAAQNGNRGRCVMMRFTVREQLAMMT